MRTLIVAAASLLSAPALARLAVPDLPEAVMAHLQTEWPGYQLREVEQEGANWEVEIETADGEQLEVLLDASGAVLHQHAEADEEKIALGDLPAAVTTAIQSGWPGATLRGAERGGAAYEVELETSAGVRMEVLLQADGSVSASSSEGAEDDEGEDED